MMVWYDIQRCMAYYCQVSLSIERKDALCAKNSKGMS